MFWLIVLGVVVVGFALAWWSSGRARPGGVDDARIRNQRRRDEGSAEEYGGSGGP